MNTFPSDDGVPDIMKIRLEQVATNNPRLARAGPEFLKFATYDISTLIHANRRSLEPIWMLPCRLVRQMNEGLCCVHAG